MWSSDRDLHHNPKHAKFYEATINKDQLDFLGDEAFKFPSESICNTFFSDDKHLKSDMFNYVIIGIKKSSDKGSYDIYGYLQLKSGRWTNKDLLNWVRYPVTGYLSTDRIFQRIEKEWKPHDVVLHIKSIADVLFTEGGEIRTNQPIRCLPSPHQQWSCIPRSMKLLKFRLIICGRRWMTPYDHSNIKSIIFLK